LTEEEVIRVVVADDHGVVRAGLRAVLEATREIRVVGEAEEAEGALALIEAESPHVLLVDVSMPGRSGIEVAAVVRDRFPSTAVLIVSMHDHPSYVLEALRAGAAGYVLKDAEPEELRAAVRLVWAGGQHLPPALAATLGTALAAESLEQQKVSRLQSLTEREIEVLILVTEGRTSREIGDALGISHRTVETHRESVMTKLEIRSVAGLTRFVIETELSRG
jgi:DNA-binding NarL/FixJ family response regulator